MLWATHSNLFTVLCDGYGALDLHLSLLCTICWKRFWTSRGAWGAFRIGAKDHMSLRLQAISPLMERSSVVSGLINAVSRNVLMQRTLLQWAAEMNGFVY